MNRRPQKRLENSKVGYCLSGKEKKKLHKQYRSEFNRKCIEQGLKEYKACGVEQR